nr:MAG TPA: hypothetical protein [Caudoviricetes sp.]
MRSILAIKFCDTDRKNDKKSRKNRLTTKKSTLNRSKNKQIERFFKLRFI